MKNHRVWLITGSSRGFGRHIAEEVLRRGERLVATARAPEHLQSLIDQYGESVQAAAVDVTRPADIQAAVALAVKTFGRLDVLVNNAGYGFTGAFEEMSADAFQKQIDTNFWGVIHACRAAVPLMRKQGFGHIIQISSVGGRAAFPGLSAYHAAKFAVEGFSETLAQELAPLGIRVTIVEPGGFRTDWAGASMGYAVPLAAYDQTVGAMRDYMKEHADEMPGDPRKAAAIICDLLNMPEPPLRLPLGNDALVLLRNAYHTSLEALEQWRDLTKSTDRDGLVTSDTDHAVLHIRPHHSSMV
ncbi:MAG: oxidoreductase [Blastocatellia bacterium]